MAKAALEENSARRISVIIVDDERMARARLRRLLSDEPDVVVVSECADGQEAVAAILAHRPDLVFLDIQMPELTGFQVLETLPPNAIPNFVFVTAFNEYALDAFAVNALDYLVKPFDEARFHVTIERARDRVRTGSGDPQLLSAIQELAAEQRQIRAAMQRSPAESFERREYLERLTVKTDGNIIFVRVDDIDYMEAQANYIRLNIGAERYLIRETMSELARQLDPSRFARIHRGTIVNLDRIKEIQPWFSGDAIVILRSGVKLRLSRLFRDALPLVTRRRK